MIEGCFDTEHGRNYAQAMLLESFSKKCAQIVFLCFPCVSSADSVPCRCAACWWLLASVVTFESEKASEKSGGGA